MRKITEKEIKEIIEALKFANTQKQMGFIGTGANMMPKYRPVTIDDVIKKYPILSKLCVDD